MQSNRGFRTAHIAAALAATVLLGALAIGPVHASTKSELDAAKASLNALLGKINAENATISSLQAQASAIAVQIDKVQSRIATTQGQIVNLEQDIRAAEGQLLGAQELLDHRAWVAYEDGPGSNIEFLLGSTSLSDLTDRLEIVNHVAQSDADLIQQIHDQQNLLAAKTASLQSLQVQLQSQKSDLSKQEKAIVARQSSALSLLAGLNKDKAAANALVTKLGAQYAAELRAAELARRAAQGFISGVLFACPVDQPRAYADDFGAPRYSGGFHLHAGNDIVAPRGTPIRAPFPGTATQSGNDLGGLAVIVTGNLGYVYNAHLDSYQGSFPRSVSTGEIIGYVGDSGDAKGGVTHDHFEWHPNVIPANPHVSPYGVSVIGSAIDPWPYLNSVCG